jgi:hypothetical protein
LPAKLKEKTRKNASRLDNCSCETKAANSKIKTKKSRLSHVTQKLDNLDRFFTPAAELRCTTAFLDVSSTQIDDLLTVGHSRGVSKST